MLFWNQCHSTLGTCQTNDDFQIELRQAGKKGKRTLNDGKFEYFWRVGGGKRERTASIVTEHHCTLETVGITMKRILKLTICLFVTSCLFSSHARADVVLTFDQSGAVDGSAFDPAYGDRVVESPDSNGHAYDIIAGTGLGLTPNVEVNYVGTGEPRIWTAGYGDLPFVLFDDLDFEPGFGVELVADPGFEVGIIGFDLAAFGSDQVIPGVQIVNESGASVWSAAGAQTISGSTRSSFSTGGVFGSSLTIDIDLTGLGGGSDNIGIANIQFGQRAVPEPSGAGLLLMGVFGLLARRKRSAIL